MTAPDVNSSRDQDPEQAILDAQMSLRRAKSQDRVVRQQHRKARELLRRNHFSELFDWLFTTPHTNDEESF